MNLVTEDDPAVEVLRAKMDHFYESTKSYMAFQQPSEMPAQWNHVRAAITALRDRAGGRVRVLEIGAGRTGFATFVADLRDQIEFTAQDVTHANAAYLDEQADHSHLGPVATLSGTYHIIFSTFVFEHVSDPRKTLAHLLELLAPGGRLFIFCPRYDFPFYLSHSADHYSPARRFALGVSLLGRRIGTLFSGRPAFLIHTDPAVLHLDWAIDRDAIHWVSLLDLRAFLAPHGKITRLPIGSGGVKDWIVKNLLQVNLCLDRG